MYLSIYLKSYFSEEQKMKRLRKYLIRRSEIVKYPSKPKFYSVNKAEKITNLPPRGGSNELSNFLFKTSQNVDALVTYLLGYLENKIDQDTKLKIIFVVAKVYLTFLVQFWKIEFFIRLI
jgi:hypothetical protein